MGQVWTIGVNSLPYTNYPQLEEKQNKVTDQFPGAYYSPLCGGGILSRVQILRFSDY